MPASAPLTPRREPRAGATPPRRCWSFPAASNCTQPQRLSRVITAQVQSFARRSAQRRGLRMRRTSHALRKNLEGTWTGDDWKNPLILSGQP